MQVIITKYNITPPNTKQGIINYIFKGYHFSEGLQTYDISNFLLEDVESDERFEFSEVYELTSSFIKFKMFKNNIFNVFDVINEYFDRQPNGDEYVYRVRFIDGGNPIFDAKLELESCFYDETNEFWELEAVNWIKFFMDKWANGYVRPGVTSVTTLLDFLFSETPFNVSANKLIINGGSFYSPEQYTRLTSYFFSNDFFLSPISNNLLANTTHFVTYLVNVGIVRSADQNTLINYVINGEPETGSQDFIRSTIFVKLRDFFITATVNPATAGTTLMTINRGGTYNLKQFVIDNLNYFGAYMFLDEGGDVNFLKRTYKGDSITLNIVDDTSHFTLGDNTEYKGVFVQFKEVISPTITRSGYFILSLEEQKFTINSEAPDGYLDLTNSFLMTTETINGILTITGHTKDNVPRIFAYDRTIQERLEDYQDVIVRKLFYENELYLGNEIYNVKLLSEININGTVYTIKTMSRNFYTKFAKCGLEKGSYTVEQVITSNSLPYELEVEE
jgi:hypothetical protein